MERKMRRVIEKHIEFGISDLNIMKLSNVIAVLGPFVRSNKDALFGYLIGSIRSFMICYTDKVYNRMPSQAEHDELWKMLLERREEIASKITREFGR